MSPLNQCNREKEKLERQLKSCRSRLEGEKAKQEFFLRICAREKLKTVMYSSLFKEVLFSIKEDAENARTANEARTWINEIIDRFIPAFDAVDDDPDPSKEDYDIELLGVDFNKDDIRTQYYEIFKELVEKYMKE